MPGFVERIRSGLRLLYGRRADQESVLAALARKVDRLEEKLFENSRQWEDLARLITEEIYSLRTLATESNKDIGRIATKLNRVAFDLDFVRNRQAAYLGDYKAVTYLNDKTPIVVDTRDPGPAAVALNGGVYEFNNVEIMLSFVKPDTVFLDVGANIGIFSLKVAARLDDRGRVYAFEPQEGLAKLIRRSAFMNGFGQLERPGKITSFDFGLSDKNGYVGFRIPPNGHLGGGQVHESERANSVQVVRLDDYLGPDFRCDLVKMDIEGHEAFALRGMEKIIANSPNVKIMFEKTGKSVKRDSELEAFFGKQDMDLFGVRT